jgi:hypothetical protein
MVIKFQQYNILEKSVRFHTLDFTKFSSVALNMTTISGTTHIKMIFIISPGNGKHLDGKVLCSSDDSVTQLIHVRGLEAVRRCYAEEGGKCYAKLLWWG